MNENQRKEEGTSHVARLVALKRYEQPGPGFDTRMSARIHARIAGGEARLGLLDRLYGIGDGSPIPAFRYAAAAVVMIGAGATLYLGAARDAAGPGLAASPPITREDTEVAIAEPSPIADTDESVETYQKPIFVFEVASNRPSWPAQYGTGPTMPVRFDR